MIIVVIADGAININQSEALLSFKRVANIFCQVKYFCTKYDQSFHLHLLIHFLLNVMSKSVLQSIKIDIRLEELNLLLFQRLTT